MPALRRTLNPLVSGAMVASGLAFLSVAGPLPAASADQPTTKVVGVFSANDSSSLLTAGGDVYSWGSNAGGQSGQGGATTLTTVTATPTKVSGLPAGQKIVQYDQGGTGLRSSFALALTDTGDLYAWGNDDNGQLGNGTPLTDSSTPVLVTAAWGRRQAGPDLHRGRRGHRGDAERCHVAVGRQRRRPDRMSTTVARRPTAYRSRARSSTSP